MEFPLEFEEVADNASYHEEIVPWLVEDFYERGCEHPGCRQRATMEWIWADEDKSTYYSYRCDDHPVRQPEYAGIDL